MKILYYNDSLRVPHGSGTHAKEVFHALKRIPGIEVHAFSEEAHSLSESPSKSTWLKSAFQKFPYCIRLARALWLRDYRALVPDLINYGNDSWVVFFRSDLRINLLRHIKRNSRVSLLCAEVNAIICDEAPYWLPLRGLWVKHEIRHLNHADLIMVVSNYLKRQLVSGGIDGAKILVNQNGANTNHFNPNKWTRDAELRRLWGVPDGSFVFGYVGGMECFRKLPLVVKIFSDFAHDHPSAHLVMIGSGSDAERIADARLALPAELRQRIHLPGPLPYENAPLAMASFDCAIFPFSNPYGSPQKLFEYLAMELPVLGPEVPAVTEIFKDTYHMRLAIQDGSNLRTLFEEMLQNPGKNRQMAACGRNLVVGHYTWDANARRLYDFLKLHLPTHQ